MEVKQNTSEKVLRPEGGPRSFRSWIRPAPIAISVGVLAFAAWFTFAERGLWERHRLSGRFDEQALQIARLETEKAALQRYYDALDAGDPHALERAAREQHLAAANEKIYDIKIEPAAEKK